MIFNKNPGTRARWMVWLVLCIQCSITSLSAQQKKDIGFILRGFDSTCYFCDSLSYAPYANAIVKVLNELSFGKVKTFDILNGGIDFRSPVELQSIRDIEVLQASLDGWPGPKWDWLRNRTDYWKVVPNEYKPIIENAIAWMKLKKQDFPRWRDSTAEGKQHYQEIQTNVQRMGSSSAADYLLNYKMPVTYNPLHYSITLFILNSAGNNMIAGGGAQSNLNYFGVLDANGKPYPSNINGNFLPLAYIGVTPLNNSNISTPVHEAIHAFGMGTHDMDPNGLVASYSVMAASNTTSINTLPAWNRYYWTKWLSKNTITLDSNLVVDLKNKIAPSDTNNKYILQLKAGDAQGRGGTYREKYDGKWYEYTVDALGTLTFTTEIKNIKFAPATLSTIIPELMIEGQKAVMRVIHDGEVPFTYEWIKNGIIIPNSNSSFFQITQVKLSDTGTYQVRIKNGSGSILSESTKVKVQCASVPNAPVLKIEQNKITASGSNIKWFRNGVLLPDTASTITPKASGSYTALSGKEGCSSALSNTVEFVFTAIHDVSSAFAVYPNPFTQEINFESLKEFKNVGFTIDFISLSTGNTIYRTKMDQDFISINTTNVPPGFYILKMKATHSDQVFIGKFFKL